MLYRHRLVLPALCLVVMLAGCPPTPPATQPGMGKAGGEAAPVVGVAPVLEGIFIPLADRQPRTGEALAKATESLDQIAADTRRFGPATAPATGPSTQATQPHEPPPLALKNYLQGREKFTEGAYTEAIEYLDQALRLDPQAFAVLKLMGRVCFGSNQLARGSLYLQRAVVIDPHDVEVNYLLGRYWVDRGEYPTAIYYLLAAERSPERDVSLSVAPLNSFCLACALQAAGYNLAAANQFETFLALVDQPIAEYRYDRDLSVLIEETWAVQLSAAENFYVARKFAQAVPHYQQALAHEPRDGYMASRLVAALARSGQAAEAIRRAQDLLGASNSDEAIQLILWTYRQGGHESQVVPDLKARMAASSASPATTAPAVSAIALAGIQEKFGQLDAAYQTLLDYQNAHPGDQESLSRLVKLGAQLKRIDSGFVAVAKAFREQPEGAAGIRAQLAVLVGEKPEKGTLAALEKIPAASFHPAEAQRAMLLAIIAQASEQFPAAEGYFEKAIAADPNFWAAREAYLMLLLNREQFARAGELVRQAVDTHQGGPKAYTLLMDSEIAQQRYANALKIAREAKAEFPDDLQVRLALEAILMLRGEDKAAENELTFVLTRFPKAPEGYQRLIELQISRRDFEQALSSLSRMLKEFPKNRFARKLAAEFMKENREYPQAQQVLEELIREDAGDVGSVILLSGVLQQAGHVDAAIELLKASIGKTSKPDANLVEALCSIYEEANRQDEAVKTARGFVEANPDSAALTLVYAGLLVQLEMKNDADAVLKEAVKRFPKDWALAYLYTQFLAANDRAAEGAQNLEHFIEVNGSTADRLYKLSMYLEESGRFDQCVSTLRQVLSLMPDHTGANNDLGYYWVDRGEHLTEAQQMIVHALENEPNNAAYLDSLGWAYYKAGKFSEAIPQFEKAVALPKGRDVDVLTHLGDALWRAGRKDDALENWRQADALLSAAPRADHDKLKTYLAKVLRQAEAHQEPEVSPLAPPSESPASSAPLQ